MKHTKFILDTELVIRDNDGNLGDKFTDSDGTIYLLGEPILCKFGLVRRVLGIGKSTPVNVITLLTKGSE